MAGLLLRLKGRHGKKLYACAMPGGGLDLTIDTGKKNYEITLDQNEVWDLVNYALKHFGPDARNRQDQT